MKTIVLGGGLVGAPMARDLAKDKDINVSIADISDDTLSKFKTDDNIQTIKQDLSDRQSLKTLILNFAVKIYFPTFSLTATTLVVTDNICANGKNNPINLTHSNRLYLQVVSKFNFCIDNSLNIEEPDANIRFIISN